MPIPVLSLLIIIFIAWLHYEIRKNAKQTKYNEESFWKKENESNQSRRKDISSLDYLTISLDSLPMADHEDSTINSYRDIIRGLADKKVINLSPMTNTELKLKYGAANLTSLIEYDNNYMILVSMLQKWGERLYSQHFIEEAKAVLEYSIACKSESVKTYRLLAGIYKEQNTPQKIDQLIESISLLSMKGKDHVMEELRLIQRI